MAAVCARRQASSRISGCRAAAVRAVSLAERIAGEGELESEKWEFGMGTGGLWGEGCTMRQASSRPGFDHFEAVLESVRSITVEEVAAVCRRYFTADPVWVAVGPEGEGSEK